MEKLGIERERDLVFNGIALHAQRRLELSKVDGDGTRTSIFMQIYVVVVFLSSVHGNEEEKRMIFFVCKRVGKAYCIITCSFLKVAKDIFFLRFSLLPLFFNSQFCYAITFLRA